MSVERTFIGSAACILEAIRIIDANPYKVALVVDDQNRLQGTITDGDIRRGLLRGLRMDHPVSDIMNRRYTAGTTHDDPAHIEYLMASRVLRQIPILDDHGRVVDIRFGDEDAAGQPNDHWVVIMAGGLGKRLRPLTDSCPKPMLPINGRPILERIVCNLRDAGFKTFFLAVNYRSEMIEQHFGNGRAFGVRITYLREDRRLGTAGALSLLPEPPTQPILVMNGDLLTTVDFRRLVEYHREHDSRVTVCVSEFDFEVPFGVVRVENQRMVGLEEKPMQKVFVNAGIYVLDPEALHQVPSGRYFDMPHLITGRIEAGDRPAVFPIHEQWLDIGRPDDFEKANGLCPG